MVYFWGVLALGFIAAVVIGSIAWYNSKRPAGWESADTPDWANPDWAKAEGKQGEGPQTDANVEPLNAGPRIK
ncbi:photosystem II assembly protein Psb35 [Candidatus Cyanaurora vandensis]|uniref:photosystem II assembly protein Psb35 n=1 Tax=Candidatus Cyanaurora vandensis TaxID=2714958 RepID=UPI00257A691F|nr:hypothetical protein [Candidatus Cyanaurora vandensis]